MGILDTICDVVTSVVESVASVGKVFAAISVKMGISALDIAITVAKVVAVVADVLGIYSSDDSIEDLGDKALQAEEAGIKVDDFDSFDEYLDKIKSFELDPEKSKAINQTDKIAASISVLTTGIAATGIHLAPLYPLIVTHKDFFTGERLASYAETAKSAGYALENIKGCFDGTGTIDSRKEAKGFLHQAESVFNPNYEEKALNKQIKDIALSE